MKRITRTPAQERITTQRIRRVRHPSASSVESAKPRIIGGRIVRSRLPKAPEYSTEAIDARQPSPYFQIEWGRALSWKFSIFMISSFLYYNLNRSIITDAEYDRLAQEILEGYNTLSHIHKHLVTVDMLEAGTAYNIREYPRMIQHAAYHALEAFRER